MEELSEDFQAVRRAAGLSLEDAASICGISRPTYTVRENNPGEFKLNDLLRLYASMNQPGRQLLGSTLGSLFLPK
ncbi:helix-turn-helix domain-containing protein [Atopobiaceae bacterium 24-176]